MLGVIGVVTAVAAAQTPPWIHGNTNNAFVAFPYAPMGLTLDTYLAKIPLTYSNNRWSPPDAETEQ